MHFIRQPGASPLQEKFTEQGVRFFVVFDLAEELKAADTLETPRRVDLRLFALSLCLFTPMARAAVPQLW